MVLRKLFGRLTREDAVAPLTPISLVATATTSPPADAAAQRVAQRQAAEDMLQREEILDARNRLCGYRFRPAGGIPDGQAEERFLAALAGIDIADFAQRRLALIPITPEAVSAGAHLPLVGRRSPNRIHFLIDLGQGKAPLDQCLAALQAITAAGAQAAVTGLSLAPELAPLLAAAQLALLDLNDCELSHFQRLARSLKNSAPHLELAADNVPSWPERRMCGAWGIDYCLGPFTTQADAEEAEGKLDESRLILMEMLNLIRDEADLAELGAVAKKDPGIALQVLSLANSPAAGLASPVSSLEQAILVLGRQRLYRWLTVAMFRVGKTRDRDEALLEVALTRARFLEIVADGSLGKKDCDELFLVGLLSLFDVLLAMPLAKVLEPMHLAPPVKEVLLHSQGPYARYLQLALAVERGRSAQAAELAEALGIELASLGSANLLALAWAEEALGISSSDL